MDEVEEAFFRKRERERASLLVADLGAASLLHPEILRNAFASLFDLSAVEGEMKRLILIASDAQRQAREARELLVQLHHDLDRIEKRLDGVQHEQEQIDVRPRPVRAAAS